MNHTQLLKKLAIHRTNIVKAEKILEEESQAVRDLLSDYDICDDRQPNYKEIESIFDFATTRLIASEDGFKKYKN